VGHSFIMQETFCILRLLEAIGQQIIGLTPLFAITRPGFTANHLHVDVDSWSAILESCVHSVGSCGLNPSLLAHSEHIVYHVMATRDVDYYSGHYGSDSEEDFYLSGFKDFGFLSFVWKEIQHGQQDLIRQSSDASNGDILAILVVAAHAEYGARSQTIYADCPDNHDGVALVLLSDGKFALIVWMAEAVNFHYIDVHAAVYIKKSIPDLLGLVRSSSGEDCHCIEDENGKLTLSCSPKLGCCANLQPGHKLFECSKFEDEDDIRFQQLEKVLERCCSQSAQVISASAQSQTPLEQHPMLPVIQPVVHDELPAFRDADLLPLHAQFQWAEDVQTQIKIQGRAAKNEVEEREASNKVYFVSFRSGKGELFRKMLLHYKEFKHLRESLLDAGYPILLQPSKTIVLVRPDQYLEVVNSSVALP